MFKAKHRRAIYATFILLAFAGSCTRTTPADMDGQSHWLRRCISNADCGAMSCLCGVCSRVCDDSSDCSAAPGATVMCGKADKLQDVSTCKRSSEPPLLCLLACRNDADCAYGAHGLTCHEDICVPKNATASPDAGSVTTQTPDAGTPSVVMDSGPMTMDAGSAGQQVTDSSFMDAGTITLDAGSELQPPDSAVMDAGAMTIDAGPQLPLHLDCAMAAADHLPLGVKRFTSIDSLGAFAARDGVLYGNGPGQWWRVTQPLGPLENLNPINSNTALVGFGALVFDGSELFFAGTTPANRILGKLVLNDNTFVTLALQSLGNTGFVAVDGANVYWTSSPPGTADSGGVYRSDRNPGVTDALWSVVGGGPAATSLLGEFIYFATGEFNNGANTAQMYRVRKDQSAPAETFGEKTPELRFLVSDGQHLFAGLSGTRDALGNPTGKPEIAQVNLANGSLRPLFLVESGPAHLIADSTHLYWTTTDRDGLANALWVGSNRGGEAVEVAEGSVLSTLAQDSTSVYVALQCDTTSHVLFFNKQFIETFAEASPADAGM